MTYLTTWRRPLGSLIAVAAALVSPALHAAEVLTHTIEGRQLRFVLPAGHCVLDRQNKLERLVYESTEKISQGRNTVVLLFADCNELARFRKEPDYRIRSHGQFLLPLSNGKLSPLPPNYARAKALQSLQGRAQKARAESVESFVNSKLAELGTGGDLNVRQVTVGLLDANDDAIFLGLGTMMDIPGGRVRVNAVVAMTLLKGVIVAVNLFDDYRSRAAYAQMLAEQKKLMADLVQANDR